MLEEIERITIRHFHLLADTKRRTFLEVVDKNVQAARSLSSRSAIRDKIVEYRQGKLFLDALVVFTEDKYREGALVVANLTYAIRMVEDKEVAVFKGEGFMETTLPDKNEIVFDEPAALQYRFVEKEGTHCLKIVSPVVSGNEVIARDYMGFCLDGILDTLNQDPSIRFALTAENTEQDALITHSGEDLTWYEDGATVYDIRSFDDESWIVVSQDRKSLFLNRDTLSRRSVLYIVIGYGFILVLLYVSLIGYARRQIHQLTEARDAFKYHADRDALTGLHARR